MLRILVFQLSIWLVVIAPVSGQQVTCTIYGRVTDSVSREAVSDVTVFIPFTSIGTTTNGIGEYCLENIPSGEVQLSYRHVAYRPETREFTINAGDSIRLDIQLNAAVVEIDEVVREINKIDRNYGMLLFREMVTGDIWENSCVLKNPADLFFYSDGDVIFGNSRAPLRISNTYLGYDITYYLDFFRFDKNRSPGATGDREEYFTFGGLALYADKEAIFRTKKTKWRKNRKAEFQGSLVQFLQDLYSGAANTGKFYLREVDTGGADSLFYWDREQPEGRYLHYSMASQFPLPDTVLVDGPVTGQKTLYLPGPMLVFFNYLNTPDPSDDRICLLEAPEGILVFDAEGSCMTVNGNLNWTFLGNQRLLRNMLPQDYDPEDNHQ